MCRSYAEAGKVDILNAVLSHVDHLSEEQILEQLTLMLEISELAAVLNATGKFYSVRMGKGGHSGIWLEW